MTWFLHQKQKIWLKRLVLLVIFNQILAMSWKDWYWISKFWRREKVNDEDVEKKKESVTHRNFFGGSRSTRGWLIRGLSVRGSILRSRKPKRFWKFSIKNSIENNNFQWWNFDFTKICIFKRKLCTCFEQKVAIFRILESKNCH